MNTDAKATGMEVINEDQGKVLDHAKVYYAASETSSKHFLGYAYLCGKALVLLKELAPHGQFEKLKAGICPGRSLNTLDNYANFAKAVDFKKPTVGFLKDETFLLADKELPKPAQEEVFSAVAKVTKGKGMMEAIKDWRKKTYKPVPDERPLAQKQKESADLCVTMRANALRCWAVEMKKDLRLCAPDLLAALDEARTQFGHEIAAAKKDRRAK